MNGTLIYLIVVGVIFISVCCVVEFFNVFKNEPKNSVFFTGLIIGIIFTIFIGAGCLNWVLKNTPDAIDVYRGKTDVVVTYSIKNNDTISCDSTIVFKDF